jgi:hypothetical protein
LSVLLGYLSNRYIEKIKYRNDFGNLFAYLKCKPMYMSLFIFTAASVTFIQNGFLNLAPPEYAYLIKGAQPSPYRNKCHITQYQIPAESCEYFGSNVTWATFGDSHSTEIAYALAEKLRTKDIGLKHFSFSGCTPSYLEDDEFSKCSKWYNETVNYILNDNKIRNVLLNHRFTERVLGGDTKSYPKISSTNITDEILRITKRIDNLIIELASNKDNVYVFYPIPELQRNINKLIDFSYLENSGLTDIYGTDLSWYSERNKYFIHHFDNAKYPKNVYLLRSQDVFCDENKCFAVRDGVPLYFDDNHPSILGAAKLVNLIL